MKKLLAIVVLGLLLNGCAYEVVEKTSDGKEFISKKSLSDDPDFLQCEFNNNWYSNATSSRVPLSALIECYKDFSIHKICLEWDFVYEKYITLDKEDKGAKKIYKLRNALSEVLAQKNKNPLVCRKGDNDDRARYQSNIKKLKKKLTDAEQRASDADYWRSRAEQAESDASYWRSQSRN